MGRERVSIEWLRDSGDSEEPLLCPDGLRYLRELWEQNSRSETL